MNDESFSEIGERLRAGDQHAANELFVRYGQRLIALARSRLNTQMQQKVDPEDVVQSAFRTFFRRNANAPFDLSNWDSVWSLLVLITVRKCYRVARRYRSDGRDVMREQSVEGAGEDNGWNFEIVDETPPPEDAAQLCELIVQLLGHFQGTDRAIVEYLLQGYSPSEISELVHRTQRTVQRTRDRVRQWLLREHDSTK